MSDAEKTMSYLLKTEPTDLNTTQGLTMFLQSLI